MERNDPVKILGEIRMTNPDFSKDAFIENSKSDLINLYKYACNGNLKDIELSYSKQLIKKVTENPDLYRISKNFDVMNILYINLNDYKENTAKYIQLYVSVYFFDDVDNNIIKNDDIDKFWNDIWLVTYKREDNDEILKCSNCGATMEKDEENNLLKCEYCRTEKYFNFGTQDWILDDVEVVK